MNSARTIELHTAYAFDCDECGHENFVRAVVHEFSPEEKEEMQEEFGESGATGDFVSIPSIVRCSHCGCEFKPQGSVDEDGE